MRRLHCMRRAIQSPEPCAPPRTDSRLPRRHLLPASLRDVHFARCCQEQEAKLLSTTLNQQNRSVSKRSSCEPPFSCETASESTSGDFWRDREAVAHEKESI